MGSERRAGGALSLALALLAPAASGETVTLREPPSELIVGINAAGFGIRSVLMGQIRPPGRAAAHPPWDTVGQSPRV